MHKRPTNACHACRELMTAMSHPSPVETAGRYVPLFMPSGRRLRGLDGADCGKGPGSDWV